VTIQESGWSRSGTGPMSQILKATAEAFGVKRDEILSRRRHMYLVRARHVAMYLMRETLGASYPVIGRFFAMDHSTVIPAYRGIAAALPTDEKLRERVDLVRAIIAGKTETKQPAVDLGLDGGNREKIIQQIKDNIQGIWVALKALERAA